MKEELISHSKKILPVGQRKSIFLKSKCSKSLLNSKRIQVAQVIQAVVIAAIVVAVMERIILCE